MLRSFAAFLLITSACSSPPAKPVPAKPAPAPEPVWPYDCSCERLGEPIPEPSAADRVRWERTRDEVNATIDDLARALGRPCSETIEADVAQIVAAHAQTLADHHALNVATCDGFGRWLQRQTDGKNELVIGDAAADWQCKLSDAERQQISALLIIRVCTPQVTKQ